MDSYHKLFNIALEEMSVESPIPFKDQWKYIGGDSGRHRKKFKTIFGRTPDIAQLDECICSHKIVENCYLENKLSGKQIVVGNCCINRYIEDTSKKCEECGDEHRNTKDNYCSDCRGDIMKIGKFSGKTYLDIFKHHYGYCEWVLKKTADIDDGPLLSFKDWLLEKISTN